MRSLSKVEKPTAKLNSDPSVPMNENDILTVIGMGRTEEDGNVSSTLLRTEIYQIDTVECQQSYPEFLVNDEVVICAAGEGRDRYVSGIRKKVPKASNFYIIFLTHKCDSCDGDSAAPLLSEDGTMIGLVSWVGESNRYANFRNFVHFSPLSKR